MHYDKFEHSILIPCTLHDLSVLEVSQKIQLIGSLQINELVYGWFIGNQLENIVHYLPMGGMTCLSHQIELSMVIVLVCMITH